MEQDSLGSRKKDIRKEVESHSSALTNILIAEIKKTVVRYGFVAMTSKPSFLSRLDFFSALVEYFMETKDIYDQDDLNMIGKAVRNGNILVSRCRVYGSTKNLENLLQICLQLQYMINAALQKKSYFFRMGRRDPKGLDAALEMFGENIWEDKLDTTKAKA